MSKILITVPDLSLTGGVTALYNSLKLNIKYNNVEYFEIHSDLPKIFRIPQKYLQFVIKIMTVDIVHINPSLDRKSFYRDSIFAILALLFLKKLIVYWHGWENSYELTVRNNIFKRLLFNISYRRSHATILLGTVFKEKYRSLGYKGKIYIETNAADDTYLRTSEAKDQIKIDSIINLLFLSRLEYTKGLYLAIDTLSILNSTELRYKLILAGSGSEEKKVEQIVTSREDIEFLGNISGELKHNALDQATIMFFPTFFPEGLPVTLIEALLYGLPVVTRPVGGIPDVIKNEVNGFLIESLDPLDFANAIQRLAVDKELYQSICENNKKQSVNYTPAKVRERLMKIYTEL